MPFEDLSHFDERSGIVPCATPWGRWWQTVHEVNIEVNIPAGTKSKDIKGKLFGIVRSDEMIWTIEDGNKLWIVLTKVPPKRKDEVWAALLNDNYAADAYTMHEMRKKLDLEWFQIENPGFDFSKAKLSKPYDRIPGTPFTSQIAKKASESSEKSAEKGENSKDTSEGGES